MSSSFSFAFPSDDIDHEDSDDGSVDALRQLSLQPALLPPKKIDLDEMVGL